MPRLGDYIRLGGPGTAQGQVIGLLLEVDYAVTVKVNVVGTDELLYFTLDEFNTRFKAV